MSLSIVHTRAALGVNAPPITVEVHISKGLPGLTMVGLPETTVKEARDRVRSAIINNVLIKRFTDLISGSHADTWL